MSARVPVSLFVAAVVGVLAGSGLAGLAEAVPNDPCSDFGSLPEGTSSSVGALELWPPGLRCRYFVGSDLVRSEQFGPTTAEHYAWIAAAALLAGLALLRRDSAFLRGAATMACVLALLGAVWLSVGGQVAIISSVVPGPPFALALDHRLRPAEARSLGASLAVAIALAVVACWAVLLVLLSPLPAIGLGVLLGGLVSARVARRPPRRAAVAT
jgi:hypothetical protein